MMVALSAAILVVLLRYTMRAYRRVPAICHSPLLGKQAVVIEWSGETGFVWAEGNRWQASGMTDLAANSTVRIPDISGLTLIAEDVPSPDEILLQCLGKGQRGAV